MQKVTFIITSVIYFKDTPLSYSVTRSIFTPEERLVQTERTIASIREHVPDAYIVLLEMGVNDTLPTLQQSVDMYMYIGNKKIVRWACDGPHKGLGEAIGLLYAMPLLKNVESNFIFKISGRYFLNDAFSLDNWGMMEKCTGLMRKGSLSTRLYGFPKKMLPLWRIVLVKSILPLLRNESIESTMARFLPTNKLQCIPLLGITGVIAPTSDTIRE